MCCCVRETFAIKSRSCLKSRQNFDLWGHQVFLRGGGVIIEHVQSWWVVTYLEGLAPGSTLLVKQIVLVFNVENISMLKFEHFWKCTHEIYPLPPTFIHHWFALIGGVGGFKGSGGPGEFIISGCLIDPHPHPHPSTKKYHQIFTFRMDPTGQLRREGVRTPFSPEQLRRWSLWCSRCTDADRRRIITYLAMLVLQWSQFLVVSATAIHRSCSMSVSAWLARRQPCAASLFFIVGV